MEELPNKILVSTWIFGTGQLELYGLRLISLNKRYCEYLILDETKFTLLMLQHPESIHKIK
jgi:hypothetical protein